MKITKTNMLLTALIYAVIGVLFIIYKGTAFNWMLTVGGILLIVLGIVELCRKDVIVGVIALVLGAVTILGGWLFAMVILIIIGAVLVIKGIYELIFSFQTRSVFGVIVSLLTIAVGGMLIACYWTNEYFFIALGIVFCIDAAIEFVEALTIKQVA